MSDVWAKIEGFAGQKMETLSHKKVFTVTEVSNGNVYFVPQAGSGEPHSEPKEVFELAERQEWVRTNLRPKRVAEFYKETYKQETRNSSYIAAILKKALEP